MKKVGGSDENCGCNIVIVQIPAGMRVFGHGWSFAYGSGEHCYCRVGQIGALMVRGLTLSLTATIVGVLSSDAVAGPIRYDHHHQTLVAVNPPGHGSQHDNMGAHWKVAELLPDLDEFLQTSDPATLPEGFDVRGHGVVVFYAGNSGGGPRGNGAPRGAVHASNVAPSTTPFLLVNSPSGDVVLALETLWNQPLVSTETSASVTSVVPVPEPASLALVGGGLLANALRLRIRAGRRAIVRTRA